MADPDTAAASPVLTYPTALKLHHRVAARFPTIAPRQDAFFGPSYAPYFATFRQEPRPLEDSLRFRKGTFVLVVYASSRCPHGMQHPPPLDRPEIATMVTRALSAVQPTSRDPVLVEIPVDYFDVEPLVVSPCCLRIDVISVACGNLYRAAGPAAHYSEKPGTRIPVEPPELGPERTGDELRATIQAVFPDVGGGLCPGIEDRGMGDGTMLDALDACGVGTEELIVAVRWGSGRGRLEQCAHGIEHAEPQRRARVKRWLATSAATTGFRTREGQPLLIAQTRETLDVDVAPSDEQCCLDVSVLCPSKRLVFRRTSAGVAWEIKERA